MASDEIRIDARFAGQYIRALDDVEIDGKNMRGRKSEFEADARALPGFRRCDLPCRDGVCGDYPKRTCARGETLGDRTIDFQVLRAAAVRRTVSVNESR